MGKDSPDLTTGITRILLQSIADRASLNNGSASVSTFKLASLEQVLLRAQRKLEKSLPNEGDLPNPYF